MARADKREPTVLYSPCCGLALQYVGYYRCPQPCGQRVELGKTATAEQAARIRRERGQGELYAEAGHG